MRAPQRIGISSVSIALADETSIDDVDVKDKELLRSFGFSTCHVGADRYALIEKAVSGLDLQGVDRLQLYRGFTDDTVREPLDVFRYESFRLHHAFDLSGPALTYADQGCGGLLVSIDEAISAIETGRASRVLCVAGDVLGSRREIMYNLMSDAACAFIVERDARFEPVAFHQVTQSYYWDTSARQDELLAAYFPMSRNVLNDLLSKAGIGRDDIAWTVPHNVSLRSWELLTRVVSLPRVYTKNIARIGHTVSCDHLINLDAMAREGLLTAGDHLLLFTFGFGATWTAMIVRYSGS